MILNIPPDIELLSNLNIFSIPITESGTWIKFRGVKLPGGLELNGREIYEDGERELESIKQKMQLEYELPPLDFIG